jgi:hypothetical protein
LRGQKDHSVHLVVNEVLAAAGFSLEDIIAWGGQVRYDASLPDSPVRLGAVQRGEADAIFDDTLEARSIFLCILRQSSSGGSAAICRSLLTRITRTFARRQRHPKSDQERRQSFCDVSLRLQPLISSRLGTSSLQGASFVSSAYGNFFVHPVSCVMLLIYRPGKPAGLFADDSFARAVSSTRT